MEKLWTIPELMERHGWTNEDYSIRKVHQEMRHIGKGKKTRVPESALMEWERAQMQEAGNAIREASGKRRKKAPALQILPGSQGGHIVPRTREEALRQLGIG